jgi:hypothetical protein
MIVGDAWTGLGRGLALSVLMGTHYIFRYLETFERLTVFDFFIPVNWQILTPYFTDLAHWGVLLFPIWVLIGFVGHPICLAVSLIESLNRYAFGQSGVIGRLFMTVQVVRGAGSVALVWWFLDHAGREWLAFGVTAATFLGMLPVWWNEPNRRSWRTYLTWPLACTAGAFAVSFGVIAQLERDFWDAIRFFSFAWFLVVDLLFPFAYSFQHYWIANLRVITGFGIFNLFRSISQLLVAPLFIAAAVSAPSLPPLAIAFVVVHAVQKAQTEPHVFAFAVVLTAITFPEEYGSDFADANFLLALLIVSKAEVLYPVLHYFERSRPQSPLVDEFCTSSDPRWQWLVTMNVFAVAARIPTPELPLRMPVLLWSLLTGAPTACGRGVAALAVPSYARPFWFFAFPVREGVDFRSLFTHNLLAHPVEAPAYTSVSLALSRAFGSLARSGKLGFVTAGDVYLFRVRHLSAFVHVMAIEAGSYRIQVRGLEFNRDTYCHGSEDAVLQRYATGRDCFLRGFESAFSVHELRQKGIPLRMYDVARIAADQAFLGADPPTAQQWFAYAFCFVIAGSSYSAANLRPVPEILLPRIERVTALEPDLARLFVSLGSELSGEQVHQIVSFWGVIALALFDEAGALNTAALTDAFKGAVTVPEDYSWVYSATLIFSEIVIPAIRLGVAALGLVAAHLAPVRREGAGFFDEVRDFLVTLGESTCATALGSPSFEKAIFVERQTIISMEVVPGAHGARENVLLRFSLVDENGDVFQVNQEFVRGLWASEIRDVMFWSGKRPNVAGRAENTDENYLTSMVVQSCDNPVGFPAYTSTFIETLHHPLNTDSFVQHVDP